MGDQGQTRTQSEEDLLARFSRLVLTGFMGAGKSTVGPLLAAALGWRFVDLDSLIESACGSTVAEIFRSRGEAYFRAQERRAIEGLGDERHIVLALGGGTVEDPQVLSSLVRSSGTYVVFLDAPLPALLARVREGQEGDTAYTRPLLAAPGDLEARHARRLPLYRSAHLTVETAQLTPQMVADHILSLIQAKAQIL